MAKKSGSAEPASVDLSLIVANLSDVLFTPLEKESGRFLKYRADRVNQKVHEWAELKSPVNTIDNPEDLNYLVNLDPTQWKDQDHYAVIGVKGLRFRATEEDIKKAYRLRVLKHHPDKRQAAGEVISPDGDYFACIVKAYEILGNQPKKRSYDSVDPCFDDYIPPKSCANEDEFFTVYGEWFELNSRWSNITPVPLLGNMLTSRERVEHFYDFWYSFDSWREYSYLDEEDKEKGQFREERRWIDKQNKVARAKLKKEEMARIRLVVDSAYAGDPRIVILKNEDNQRKVAKKMAKQIAAKEAKDLEDKLRHEAEEKIRKEREKIEAEEREKELASKKEKDAFKKAMKKERKLFRTLCKSYNYFSNDDKIALENMTHLEHLCESSTLQSLEELNKQLTGLSYDDAEVVFLKKVEELVSKIEREKAESTKTVLTRNGNGSINQSVDPKSDWSHEELSLLVKAVNVFPAGTIQRWDVVANFIHQHHQNGRKRSAKEVLAKAKDLKSSDFSKSCLKEEANDRAFALFEKNVKNQVVVEAEATTRDDENAPVKDGGNGTIKEKTNASQSKPWSTDDQKLLEQALKTFPSSHSDRWDRIAECVPGRTKKECMARFKELAALVKAKKSAQNAGKV